MVLPLKIVVFALLAAAWDRNAPMVMPHGFLNGGDYLQKTEIERHNYTMGLLDGLFASPMMGADNDIVQRLKLCISPMNSLQLVAIFEKYLRDHPQNWHQDGGILFVQSMISVCPPIIPR